MSLHGTTYTTNNSVILLDDIGDTSNALHCISDLSGCCVSPKKGQWLYPNETQVPNDATRHGFYRNRGMMGQVFLRRRDDITSPTGTYCCQVPTAASDSNETFCVFLSELQLVCSTATSFVLFRIAQKHNKASKTAPKLGSIYNIMHHDCSVYRPCEYQH